MRRTAFAKSSRAALIPISAWTREGIAGGKMFTAKESTRLFEMSRRLRELHIRKAAAQSNGDREEIDELQAEIDALTNYCNNVLDADTAV